LLPQLHRCVATGILDPSIFVTLRNNGTSVQECEVLDFKQQLPDTDAEYVKVVRDLVALHNSYGGFLVFGVRETERDRAFELGGVPLARIQVNKIRDLSRSYLGIDLRMSATSHSVDGQNVEAIWIAKRSMGDSPVKFVKNGPDEKPGKPTFKRGDVVFRRIESNAVAQGPEDYDFLYSARRPPSIDLSSADLAVDDPLEHNLPDRALVCSRL